MEICIYIAFNSCFNANYVSMQSAFDILYGSHFSYHAEIILFSLKRTHAILLLVAGLEMLLKVNKIMISKMRLQMYLTVACKLF